MEIINHMIKKKSIQKKEKKRIKDMQNKWDKSKANIRMQLEKKNVVRKPNMSLITCS